MRTLFLLLLGDTLEVAAQQATTATTAQQATDTTAMLNMADIDNLIHDPASVVRHRFKETEVETSYQVASPGSAVEEAARIALQANAAARLIATVRCLPTGERRGQTSGLMIHRTSIVFPRPLSQCVVRRSDDH